MSVQKRTRNGRIRWVARYRTPDGRERSKSFDTRREATAWETKQLSDMAVGKWIDPHKGRVTVGDYAKEWCETTPNPRTRRTRERLRKNLGPLADYPLGALRPSHLRDWYHTLTTGRPWHGNKRLAPSSAQTMWAMLAGMLSRAVDDGLIVTNPAQGHKPAARSRGAGVRPAEVPTVADVERLADTADQMGRDVFATMIRFTALAGLRAGEVGGLRVHDIDFLRRRLHVTAQAVPDIGNRGSDLRVPLKTESSQRIVPLPTAAVELLAAHLQRHPQPSDGPVFLSDTGRLWTYSRIGDAMRAVCPRAGLKFTFHSLRHHYASRLIAAGVDVIAVQSALGHANPNVTLQVYAHLWPSSDDRIRAALERGDDSCGTDAGPGEPDGAQASR